MGIIESKDSSSVAEGLDHPKMKQVKFSKNRQIMSVSLGIEDQNQFYKWESRLARLKKFDEYYLLLPKAYQFGKKGVCGSSGVLHIDYDNYPYFLHQEIQKRAQSNNYFNESELWYLLYGLVSAASIFKELGSKVGDIQTKNIFLNEEGQIKISNVCSWPSERTNYEKLVLEQNIGNVSPEELAFSRQGRIDIYRNRGDTKQEKVNKIDQYMCQSFSIGITMLQSALLRKSSSFYKEQKNFDYEELERRVMQLLRNQAKTNYSKALRIAIAGLCEAEPSLRLGGCYLYQHLKEHDSEIVNLKSCEIEALNCPNMPKYEQIIATEMGSSNNNPPRDGTAVVGNTNANINTVSNSCGNNSTWGVNATPVLGSTFSQYNYNFVSSPYYQYYSGAGGLPVSSNPVPSSASSYIHSNPSSQLYRWQEYSSQPATGTYGSHLQARDWANTGRTVGHEPPAGSFYASSSLYSNTNKFSNTSWNTKNATSNYNSQTGKLDLSIKTTAGVCGKQEGAGSRQPGAQKGHTQLTPTFNTSMSLKSDGQTVTNANVIDTDNNGNKGSHQITKPQNAYEESNGIGGEKHSRQLMRKMLNTPNNTTPISYETSISTQPQPYVSSTAHPPINHPVQQLIPKEVPSWMVGNQQRQAETSSKVYTFSNISSIGREQAESANKVGNTNVGPFTPTKNEQSDRKGEDSALDLLKRINQEIASSKSRFVPLS